MPRISAKVKRSAERLEEIRQRAAEMNAAAEDKSGVTGANLAEEAAALGLELVEMMKEAK